MSSVWYMYGGVNLVSRMIKLFLFVVAEKGVVTLPFCAIQFWGALIPDEKLKRTF